MNKLINSNSFIFGLGSLIITIINLLLISLSPIYLFVYFGIILILIFVIQTNIIRIYVRFDDKYQTGNAYFKRMTSTVGILTLVTYLLVGLFIYLIAMINIYLALVIAIILIASPFSQLLINKFWIKYDQAKYLEFDQANPSQKKYWNEPKEVYQSRTKW